MSSSVVFVPLLLALFSFSAGQLQGEPPSFTAYPRSQVVLDSTHRPGSSFTLSCGVSGSPEPTITWRRNGQTLGGENGSLLTVNNIVDGEDASVIGVNYTCEAENTFGRIRSIDAVIKLAEFNFDSAAQSVPARVGGKVALRCPILKAVPPPVIVWRFSDGTLVPAVDAEGGDLAGSRYQLLPSGHLVIVNITEADIEASFYCEVTNALIHNTNRSSGITILQSSVLRSRGPQDIYVYHHQSSVRAEVGKAVRIYNVIEPTNSNQSLSVRYERAGSPSVGAVTSEGYLEIPVVEEAHQGTYTARYTSRSTEQVLGLLNTTLDVYSFPEITYASPHTTLVMGQPVALCCNFTSVPAPTVKWTLNGSRVEPDGQLSINTVDGSSVLTVTGLTTATSGMYQCFVENKMGIVEKSISVSVLVPTLTARSDTVVTTTGNHTSLSCIVGNIGNATLAKLVHSSSLDIVWRVNGTHVTSPEISSNYTVYPALGVLALKKTIPELQGTYTCELSTDSDISDTITVSIQEGCFPDIFRPSVPVGQSVSVPCDKIDRTFSHNGNVTWTCVRHLTWEGDLSQCYYRASERNDVILTSLMFRVKSGVIGVIAQLFLRNDMFRDFLETLFQNSSVNITDVRLSYAGETEENRVFVVLLILEIDRRALLTDLQRLAGVSVPLDNTTTGVPVYPGILVFVPGDSSYNSCPCPVLWSNIEGNLSEHSVVTVDICNVPSFVQKPCTLNDQGYECSTLFTDDPQVNGNCVFDIDGDGIPNSDDQCDFCCAGEYQDGFEWQDTIVGAKARLSCSLLHPSFNAKSFAVRKCNNNQWGSIDTSQCTFDYDADLTIVLWEGVVNPTRINQEIEEAAKQELQDVFGVHGLIGIEVWQHSTSQETTLVTAVLEFPQDVNSSVISVYNSASDNRLNQSTPLFVSSTVLYGHRPTETCPCTAYPSGTVGMLLDTCVGAPQPPCSCNSTSSGTVCECNDPYASVLSSNDTEAAAGVLCSLDSDGDKIADIQDHCVFVYDPTNLCQSLSLVGHTGYQFCSEVTDDRWGILWADTAIGLTDYQRCPGGVRTSFGIARRACNKKGKWDAPDLSSCHSLRFAGIWDNVRLTTVQEVYDSLRTSSAYMESTLTSEVLEISSVQIAAVRENVELLVQDTVVSTHPLLPMDLRTANDAIEIFSEYSKMTNLFASEDFNEDDLFTIIDNLLVSDTATEWNSLNQEMRNGAALLMRNIERLAISYAANLDTNKNATVVMEDGVTNMAASLETPRIALTAEYITSVPEMPSFKRPGRGGDGDPQSHFMSHGKIPEIKVPTELFSERRTGSHVSVVTVAINSLQTLLPRAEFFSTPDVKTDNLVVGSLLLSTQVSTFDGYSDSLRHSPVQISFPIDSQYSTANSYCVFWNFSEGSSVPGLGGWSRDGIADGDKGSSSASCSSTHLTTFAILVDTTGLETTISEPELFALELVSYIGCGVSLACLLVTVIFFLCLRKELINKVINYVHLNLCISLICGLIVFLAGVETAVWSLAACTVVATLLHYFFLAAFSWMLCEGIMLYNLLVKVFRANERKWIYIYTALGWGIPVPIVAIAVGSRWEYYHIPQSYNISDPLYNVTRACWLSHEYGTIAAFLVPMLAIVVINIVFTVIALRGVYRFKRDQKKRTKGEMSTREAGITLMKSIIILSPLLGVTWVVGLLAVNNYTTVFAWLFCFLNAFQGVFIFFFHVVRNDKVWPKLVGCLCGVKTDAVTDRKTISSRISRGGSFATSWIRGRTLSLISSSSKNGNSSSIFESDAHSNGSGVVMITKTVPIEMDQVHPCEDSKCFVNKLADIDEETIEACSTEEEPPIVYCNEDSGGQDTS